MIKTLHDYTFIVADTHYSNAYMFKRHFQRCPRCGVEDVGPFKSEFGNRFSEYWKCSCGLSVELSISYFNRDNFLSIDFDEFIISWMLDFRANFKVTKCYLHFKDNTAKEIKPLPFNCSKESVKKLIVMM